jgi:hypothetical protein
LADGILEPGYIPLSGGIYEESYIYLDVTEKKKYMKNEK